VLRGFGQGRAVTSCAGSALPLEEKDKFARSDKSHIVQHKTGRKGKATGGLGTGNPARPRADRFMMHNVFLSYGRGSTGRAVTPPAAPTSQLKRWARE